MTFLYDLFSEDDLTHALNERLVARRLHPNCPLAILNYTERCQYERGLWSPVTTTCRGLIYHTETMKVVARPFRKFFNYGQAEAPAVGLASTVAVTDKLDGSLGILYPTPEGYAVATRGSFESDQARHATEVYRARYAGVIPPPGQTLLFEIVYPQNRIVVDYGAQDDLILLGAVDITTGRSVGPETVDVWAGPRADIFPCRTVADALALPPRPNAEGVVLHLLDTDERVKIKQEDYVALHRIVTGLNERVVWEHLSAGKPLTELLAPLPDEFHDWTRRVADNLSAKVLADSLEIENTFAALTARLPEGWTRKDFASLAKDTRMPWGMFARLDGKDYLPSVWKQHYPAALQGPRVFTEDTA